MKIFAYYLPQFHTIPENDKWWGKGFTEWTNVKKAQPLYKGHNQPRIPLDNNYYNLMDKETMVWQTRLMNDYYVDGLIYYHYYFKGKKMLEKPAENLLKWRDIQQQFFFCWANHSWLRTWEGKKEVLMPMEYGDVNDWEEHFQYLLPFFGDERYEKKNNMPLFEVFESDDEVLNEVFNYFDKRCRDNGFDGIYLIETRFVHENDNHEYGKHFDVTKKIHLREPSYSRSIYLNKIKRKPEMLYRLIQRGAVKAGLVSKPQIFDNDKLYGVKMDIVERRDVIQGLSFEWDNTPRHKERGYIINPVSKEMFFNYMSKINKEEYVFVNAWNEWCEGMILEPTEKDKYKYLDWIKEWRNKNNDF